MSAPDYPKTFTKKPGTSESGRIITCPVCGSDRFRNALDCGEWRYVCCRGCGLVYQNPQPQPDGLLKRYDESYFRYEKDNAETFARLAEMGLRDIAFDQLAQALPDRSILDIGCATGRLLYGFRQKGWRTAGIEVCAESAEYGNREFDVGIYTGMLENAPYPPESFSVVHSSHVIEHVNDPRDFVSRSVRLLKPGGLFICTTPDRQGFQARLFGAGWRSAIADHLFLFSSRDLKRLFSDVGLKIVRRKTWGGLGEGYAPKPVKRLVDKLVKLTGQGDVVILAAKKLLY